MHKPYRDSYCWEGEHSRFIRTFEADTDERDLVWHRDTRDRVIDVVWNTGWQIQFEDQMPVSINTVTEIPRMVYHRLIKGEGNLILDIIEL
jgi:hypothetical protein